MRHVLPSLNALRVAEAIGRHGSIVRAADELGVTPGAVSRQLALLEAHFGCSLFIRAQRGLALSERGRHYLERVGEAFDIIDQASDELAGIRPKETLSVQVWGTFGTEWLLPRLHLFEAAHPEVEIRLTARLRSVDFNTDDADVGVVLGVQNRSRSNVEFEDLYVPDFLPVMSKALVAEKGLPASPDELSRFTLLHSMSSSIGWRDWLEGIGATSVDPAAGHLLENSNQVYRAMRLGAGVALAQTMLLVDELAAGDLVAPFPEVIQRPDTRYILVWPKRRTKRADVAAFRTWIVGEIAQHKAKIEAQLPRRVTLPRP